MRTMEIDQAIFASSDRGPVHGYQLICKSAGIDAACSQTLCRWSPTQLPLEPDQWTLNFFRVSETAVAVSRSLWGGPEYSGRGSAEVVTLILILRDEQFAAYGHDPLAVASTALAIGRLKLPLDMAPKQLPRTSLPSGPLIAPLLPIDEDAGEVDQSVDALVELILLQRRVAVIGQADPWRVIERVLPKLPQQARRRFSFTTGLIPALSRPFQVHFLASADAATRRSLHAQDMVCLHASERYVTA